MVIREEKTICNCKNCNTKHSEYYLRIEGSTINLCNKCMQELFDKISEVLK